MVAQSAWGITESRVIELYEAGQFDSLRHYSSQLPETTGTGQFVRGLFEQNGETARFYYDRSAAFYSDSPAKPYALEKLWQYHYAKGDYPQAEKYFGFLKSQFSKFSGLTNPPDFKQIKSDPLLLSNKTPTKQVKTKDVPTTKKSGWGVQVGTFGSQTNALKAGSKVKQFGSVAINPITSKGKQLYTVVVGTFASRSEAETTLQKIQTATGMSPIVISVTQ